MGSTPDLVAVARAFLLPGDVAAGELYGTGHINDTFRIRCGDGARGRHFILQRINRRIFRRIPELMDNIARVTDHINRPKKHADAQPGSRALTLIRSRDGKTFHTDDAGEAWRCYTFIEGAKTFDLIES